MSASQSGSASTASATSFTATPAPAKIFVFGGNGLLGVELLSFLTSAAYSKHFPLVTAAIRPHSLTTTNPKKAALINRLRATGVKLLPADPEKASTAEIADWLRGYDIVVSAIGFFDPVRSIEHKLLAAVQTAGNSWFIPSIFGSDNYLMYTESVPFLREKRAVIEAVKAAAASSKESGGLNYFIVHNGLFFEYLMNADPVLALYSGIDVTNSTITAPTSFDILMSFTGVPDIARLTVEALLQRNEPHVKNQVLQFAADTLTYDQLHGMLEEHFGRKFTKAVATHEQVQAAIDADVKHEDLSNRFRMVYAKSPKEAISWKVSDTFHANHAKHVKLTSVKQRLQQLYPMNKANNA